MNEINIDKYLEYAYTNDLSDLHLKSQNHPFGRKLGRLFTISDVVVSDEDVINFNNKYSSRKISINDKTAVNDFSFNYKDVRFRANVYHDYNGFCISLRQLKLFSTDLQVLGVPESIKDLVLKPNGLILITGPTGSGKSTTLAALVDFLNKNTTKHIITVEEPIEYVFKPDKSLITQREVGTDTISFESAIIDSVREDPDVIIVGEMRDRNSIEAALVAAETGHLVLSTLHTRNATSTVSRIIDMFSSDKQNQILNQLSTTLLAVLSQQLLPSIDNTKLHLATEYMIVNNAVASNIKQNKTQMIANMIGLGKKDGMHLMEDSISELSRKGLISEETVIKYRI